METRIRKLNTRIAALTLGTVGSGLLFLLTLVTLLLGSKTGWMYLMLLSVFLPGYEVSVVGAFVGAFWGAVWGAVAGALIYRIYDARWRLQDKKQASDTSGPVSPPFIFLDGNALGWGLGIVGGLALFSATAWLVVRGTADESTHAALFAWYLPGYSVSLGGAVAGAVEICVIIYVLSRIGAFTYNAVLHLRERRR
jgi:hypothetical protein